MPLQARSALRRIVPLDAILEPDRGRQTGRPASIRILQPLGPIEIEAVDVVMPTRFERIRAAALMSLLLLCLVTVPATIFTVLRSKKS